MLEPELELQLEQQAGPEPVFAAFEQLEQSASVYLLVKLEQMLAVPVVLQLPSPLQILQLIPPS